MYGPVRILVSASVATGLLATVSSASVRYYVNAASPPGGSGLTWGDAFSDLQAALAAAHSGDEVWIAQGKYRPAPWPNQTAEFAIPSGVRIFGNFVGTETALIQRPKTAPATVLTGDLLGNDGFAGECKSDNSRRVVRISGASELVGLDGCVIERGSFGGPGGHSGAGIAIENSLALISNCEVRDNQGRRGGGVLVAGSSAATFVNCVIMGNSAWDDGGGLVYENFSMGPLGSVELLGCTVVANVACGGPNSDCGGAFLGGASALVANSIFFHNRDRDAASVDPLTVEKEQICATTRNSVVSSCIEQLSYFAGNSNISGNPGLKSVPPAPSCPGQQFSCTPPAAYDLSPATGAQIIDLGGNAYLPPDVLDLDSDLLLLEAVPFDLQGTSRVLDSILASQGSASSPIVDMGAYEFVGAECAIYGTMINPPGSIACLAPPVLGSSLQIHISDPSSTLAPPNLILLLLSVASESVLIPGLGLPGAGPAGELLVDVSPFAFITPIPSVLSPGVGGTISFPVPADPVLLGARVYMQGAIFNFSTGATGLTQGLEASVGTA